MKHMKKAVSILLALVMALSAASVAFAADSGGALDERILAFAGNVATLEPTEEDLAEYNGIVSDYKALPESEQKKLSIIAADKLLQMIKDREAYVAAAESGKQRPVKAQWQAGYAKAVETMGAAYADTIAAAEALAKAVYETEVTYDDGGTNKKVKLNSSVKVEMFAFPEVRQAVDQIAATFKNATELERVLAGGWYTSYVMLYYSGVEKASSMLRGVAELMGKAKEYANPFTEEKPEAKVKRPNANDYEGGLQSEEYKAAQAAYMADQKILKDWDCRKADHLADFQIAAMQELAQTATEYKNALGVATDAIKAMDRFNADNTQSAGAISVADRYEALSELDRAYLDTIATKVRTVPRDVVLTWSTTTYTFLDIVNQCTDIRSLEFVDEFAALVNAMEEPYTNDKILQVREAYAKIPESLQKNEKVLDVADKYKAILACIAPDDAVGEPDLSTFVRTQVTYPDGVTKEQTAALIEALDKMLGKLIGDNLGSLPELLKTGVYTNATVATLQKLIYPLLGGLSSMVAKTPGELAKQLTEEKFTGAYAALLATGTKDDAGKMTYTLEDWEKLSYQNGDYGFQDGDREGFLDALATTLRPLQSTLGLAIKFNNVRDPNKGTYTYGAYEDLIPIFETLGLRGVISSAEYTEKWEAAGEISLQAQTDALYRPIFVPIINLLEDLAADPLHTLLNLLPRVGMLFQNDFLDTQLHKLTAKVGMITVPEFSLKAADVVGIINGLLAKGIEISPAETDDAGNVIKPAVKFMLSLNAEQFTQFVNDVAGCGTAYAADSVERGLVHRLGIEPDQADALLVTFRYLFGELFGNKENYAQVKALLDSLLAGNDMAALITPILDTIAAGTADEAFVTIANLLAPMPDDGEDPTTDPTNPENPTDPQNPDDEKPSVDTGDAVLAAVGAVAVAAGAAFVLSRKKKA